MKKTGQFRLQGITSILPIILLMLCCFSMKANAQSNDQAAVLQKILDLPALQPYFLKKADGSYDKVNILQHPNVAITPTAEVQKFGRAVSFIQRGDVNATVRSYFLFHELKISATEASVETDFYFFTGQTLNRMKATVKMNKLDGEWQIVASTLDKE